MPSGERRYPLFLDLIETLHIVNPHAHLRTSINESIPRMSASHYGTTPLRGGLLLK